ncbi:GNAT family N-acetyltransferase [Actinoplanes sp. NPDC051494]|uniref:GNAT family N-acetyltransferase n=1 Tax=Actinoplanes sp. NPDC051494 TaxID=3363907 RepID=UPI0037B791AA
MIEVLGGAAVPGLAGELTAAYREAFGTPPWSVDAATVARFRSRMAAEAGREGFRLVVARTDGRIEGFASGWITRAPLPEARAYPQVTGQLGAERVRALLDGAFEVDELAVLPAARGRKLGRRLLDALTGDAPRGRAWLLTWRPAVDTVAFYRRAGWREAVPLSETRNDIIVFLGPHHPGSAD